MAYNVVSLSVSPLEGNDCAEMKGMGSIIANTMMKMDVPAFMNE
jgi:hypothetical protein